MDESQKTALCGRIAKLRSDLYGSRGKSRFAQVLELAPSTYIYYETDRVPPADLLVAIADLANVDLRWLITGETRGESDVALSAHPAIRRAAQLLGDHPEAGEALLAFMDVLAESFKFPSPQPAKEADQAEKPAPPTAGQSPGETWIPILGRSAAGVAQFWSSRSEGAGVTKLKELVERYAGQAASRVQQADAASEVSDVQAPVQIVSLSHAEPGQPVEFVAAGKIKSRWPGAFAVRIDGESMTPTIRHDDLVILSFSAQAVNGQSAVVQLQDQIGVTCKIYHQKGDRTHLVPINEQFSPQAYRNDQIVWALRVLARIRPQ